MLKNPMQLLKPFFIVPTMALAFCAAGAFAAGASPAATAAMAGASATAAGPAAVVEQTSSQIIQALNANQAKLKSNPEFARQLVRKYLMPNFDFDLTSQLVLGPGWRTATPAQREAFQTAFLHYLTSTYAEGLQHYNGAKVNVFPFRGDLSKQYVKVRSQIVTPDHAPIEVDYALTKTDGGWKVFDVIIAGISYVRTYQTEFQSEIRHTSLEALIARLQNAKAPATLTAMKAAMPATGAR